MPKRITASQPESEFVPYEALGIAPSRVLTESITHGDDLYLPGQLDPTYVSEPEHVFLITLDGRRYDSVHGDYEDSMLEHCVIEQQLDGNFTHTVLRYNYQVQAATEIDPGYPSWLGLPDYDPAVHTADLRVIPAHDEARGLAYIAHTEQWAADQKALWLATDPEYAARMAAAETETADAAAADAEKAGDQ